MYIKTLTVSELNGYIKKLVDNDFILGNSNVKGEISNFKLHSSGHIYFSIKDEYSKINCVMFRSSARNLKFMPENGMKVVVKGRVSVYEKDGAYQIYCNDIELDGVGELYMAFEKLKSKLQSQGLFEVTHKKEIPPYARKIGVVTSPTGAAVRDIINVAKRRNDAVELLIYPALVQGINASESIIKAIEYLNRIDDIDVIILARGGGSIEELWCFNDEKLAYSIYNSKKAIITGVGHETDYTIVDFVSDRRAPTPSAAAELAVFNLEDLQSKIVSYKNTLNNLIDFILKEKSNSLELLKRNLDVNSPYSYIVNEYNNIDRLKELMNIKIKTRLEKEREKLIKANSLLTAHNPMNILNKGYAVIENEKIGVVNTIQNLKKLDKVKITLKDGSEEFNLKIKN
ncbi:exodeoxyribonuclease VII large subunit [Clostridium carboxidivorans P7]|uniref:exodeoxyribonuclease VII large subunit n=1 Tax=Clostridium carboxidivorans TaxID=217159 RepID=UPI0001D393E1|nr:exodeoxyribonuclease VII large subunit [Clostridium carboxidivorans]AKN34029.1 exodeoxyribonuclease VII large subunit [Clostridium carboxidivorans P7]EFG88098.1 exodeoxyribonuclease VII, large subunit [Clostridium carboxidivorans P7]